MSNTARCFFLMVTAALLAGGQSVLAQEDEAPGEPSETAEIVPPTETTEPTETAEPADGVESGETTEPTETADSEPPPAAGGEETQALPADASDAVRDAAQRCDGNDAMGCLELGNAYVAGEGVAADAERADYLLRRASEGLWHACNGGDEAACTAWTANFGDE